MEVMMKWVMGKEYDTIPGTTQFLDNGGLKEFHPFDS
jgi:hypothetical protein